MEMENNIISLHMQHLLESLRRTKVHQSVLLCPSITIINICSHLFCRATIIPVSLSRIIHPRERRALPRGRVNGAAPSAASSRVAPPVYLPPAHYLFTHARARPRIPRPARPSALAEGQIKMGRRLVAINRAVGMYLHVPAYRGVSAYALALCRTGGAPGTVPHSKQCAQSQRQRDLCWGLYFALCGTLRITLLHPRRRQNRHIFRGQNFYYLLSLRACSVDGGGVREINGNTKNLKEAATRVAAISRTRAQCVR